MCSVHSQTDFECELHTDLACATLLSYLDLDERPTFAIHPSCIPHSDKPIELIYSNSALEDAEDLLLKIIGQEIERGLFVQSATPYRAFRDWLLGIFDETERSQHENAYLFEGCLWTAVNLKRYRVVSGVVTSMTWSNTNNTRLRACLDPRASSSPKHLPVNI